MPVEDLSLDLHNFRTVPQDNETAAVQAMIIISPGYFWGLMESLLADVGYLPTENIIVLDEETAPPKLTIKEGNRRIAVLKIAYGLLDADLLDVPQYLKDRITALSPAWKIANRTVPCAIFPKDESETVDKIVTLTHGKGDKASRDKWTAVATARHNRDVLNKKEPGLDILEKYVKEGDNLSDNQAALWLGDYPLSILDEAIKKIYARFSVANTVELANKYPVIPYLTEFNGILRDIGGGITTFKTIRYTDFATKAGVPKAVPASRSSGSTGTGVSNDGGAGGIGDDNNGAGEGTSGNTGGGIGGTGSGRSSKANTDPKSVTLTLKKLKISGEGRGKVVALRNEALLLDIEKSPIAFCFLLRSMFEISAKAYCDDQAAKPNAPKAKKADGDDRHLVNVLEDIYNFMVKLPNGKTDQAKERYLIGAFQNIKAPESVLSVTSMNQLVHNQNFAIRGVDISVMFHNIFPLLRAMNEQP